MTEIAPRPLLLPFIPSPYPDEILGSWLSRVRLENGGGAWRTLLEHIGYGRRLENPLFDAIDHSEKFSAMLAFLGTTYECALLELSTLPYWLTFSASDSGARLPGTTAIPVLRRTAAAKGEITSINHLGSQRTRRRSFEPRYCPKCISQDCEEVGQAYWHRTHQLPNVLFCPKHHCELQVKCERCGAKPSGLHSRILPLPTLKCRCGFRLDKVTDSRIPSVQEFRLISISVRALDQGLPTWHRANVFGFLQLQLAQGASSSLGQYQRVIEEAFPGKIMKWSNRTETHKDDRELRFRRYLSTGSAPECCAVLAALDIDFDIATAGFVTAAKEGVNRASPPNLRTTVMTVEHSRSMICRAYELDPNRPISAVRRHYWYLRLYDPTWLQEHFPRSSNTPIPTIAEDRSELIKILSSVQPSWGNSCLLARVSAAGLRAIFRDKKWFGEQQTRSRQQMAAKEIVAGNTILLARAASLQGALEKILLSEERPARIYASSLGALVGLSARQAAAAVQSAPKLREAIAAANAGKLRRQLLWAARQLNLTGERLSKRQLGRIAGVPTSEVPDEILAEIKALHYRKCATVDSDIG